MRLQPVDKPIVTPHDFTPTYGIKFSADRSYLSIHTVLGVSSDWAVWWMVQHGRWPGAPHVRGYTKFTDLEVTEAFGLTDNFYPFQGPDAQLVERYNATVARVGRFIRSGNFLNIPGPGGGYNGDANLSIYLHGDYMVMLRILSDCY